MSAEREALSKQAEALSQTSASHIYSNGVECEAESFLPDADHPKAILQFDCLEFYQVVDMIAFEYGMGGCRSLSEFANMIDKEDPAVIDGILLAIQSRKLYERDAADPDANKKEHPQATASTPKVNTRHRKSSTGVESDMGDFLANSGIPQSKIREARERLKNRKITTEEEKDFFDWLHSEVTTEKLRHPNFDIKKSHARIKAYLDTTEKFNITASMIGGKHNG